MYKCMPANNINYKLGNFIGLETLGFIY
jgi:hypothetical protein